MVKYFDQNLWWLIYSLDSTSKIEKTKSSLKNGYNTLNHEKKLQFRHFLNIMPMVKGEVFVKTGDHKCLPKN